MNPPRCSRLTAAGSPEEARAWGQKALNRSLDGIDGVTAVHIAETARMQAMVQGAAIVGAELEPAAAI